MTRMLPSVGAATYSVTDTTAASSHSRDLSLESVQRSSKATRSEWSDLRSLAYPSRGMPVASAGGSSTTGPRKTGRRGFGTGAPAIEQEEAMLAQRILCSTHSGDSTLRSLNLNTRGCPAGSCTSRFTSSNDGNYFKISQDSGFSTPKNALVAARYTASFIFVGCAKAIDARCRRIFPLYIPGWFRN